MNRNLKLLLIVLLCTVVMLSSVLPVHAWFSDVLSGASYEFVVGDVG